MWNVIIKHRRSAGTIKAKASRMKKPSKTNKISNRYDDEQ